MLRPLFAWFVLAALVPVLVHLWTRARPPRLPWAALWFLPPVEPTPHRRLRLDEPLLLILRVAAVLLVAIAAVGPTCSRPMSAASSLTGIVRPLFLVDLSASMSLPRDGRTPLEVAATALDRWWAAHPAAVGAVAGCSGGDVIWLVHPGERPPHHHLGILDAAATLGDARLSRCLSTLELEEPRGWDIVLLTDRPVPTTPPTVSPWRSLTWWSLARPAVGVLGFGPVHVHRHEDRILVTGGLAGAPTSEARLTVSWPGLGRPATLVPLTATTFRLELLAPDRTARLLLRLEAAAGPVWLRTLPLWAPGQHRPRVALAGAWPPAVRQALLDLFYAARDRLLVERTPERADLVLAYEPDPAQVSGWLARGRGVFVYPGASAGEPPAWLPGWLHPAQPTPRGALRPTRALRHRWPELVDLPWDQVRIAHVHPLAEPDPDAEVLLETDGGLPVLVYRRVGSGELWLWTVPPGADNLAITPVWVPLWLAIFGTLAEEGERAPALAAPEHPLGVHRSRRVATAWEGSGRRWLGWWRGQDERGPRLWSWRVPAGELLDGATELGPHTLLAPRDGRRLADHRGTIEATGWWLAAALGLWSLQALLSWRRLRLGAWLVLLGLAAATAAGRSLQAAEIEVRIAPWIPEESIPTAERLAAIRELVVQWNRRTSVAVAPPRTFSWRTTDPGEPWVWWAGCRLLDPATDLRLGERLRRLVEAHGTLWLESCGDAEAVREQRHLLDTWLHHQGFDGLRALPADHVLGRTYYLLDGWVSLGGEPGVWGLRYEGHERILLWSNLLPGLGRTGHERETFVRQAVNLLIYTTTYDYKNDAVHLPFILERRRRHR